MEYWRSVWWVETGSRKESLLYIGLTGRTGFVSRSNIKCSFVLCSMKIGVGFNQVLWRRETEMY